MFRASGTGQNLVVAATACAKYPAALAAELEVTLADQAESMLRIMIAVMIPRSAMSPVAAETIGRVGCDRHGICRGSGR
jgi:hypothetical protein